MIKSYPDPKLLNFLISNVYRFKFLVFEKVFLKIARYKNLENKKNPKISIIIATYNRSEILINRTIPSILEQTYKNFEVLIIGDKCIDDTAQKIKTIKDKRLRFYDLPKRGKYPEDSKSRWFVQGTVPRNKGLELCTGSYISYISDDDVLLPNHFETMLKFSEKNDYEFVSASYTYEENGEILKQDASTFSPRIGGMQTWLYRSYLKFYKWNRQSWRKIG